MLDACSGFQLTLHGTALVALDKLDKIKIDGVSNEMRGAWHGAAAVRSTRYFDVSRKAALARTGCTSWPKANLRELADFVCRAGESLRRRSRIFGRSLR